MLAILQEIRCPITTDTPFQPTIVIIPASVQSRIMVGGGTRPHITVHTQISTETMPLPELRVHIIADGAEWYITSLMERNRSGCQQWCLDVFKNYTWTVPCEFIITMSELLLCWAPSAFLNQITAEVQYKIYDGTILTNNVSCCTNVYNKKRSSSGLTGKQVLIVFQLLFITCNTNNNILTDRHELFFFSQVHMCSMTQHNKADTNI